MNCKRRHRHTCRHIHAYAHPTAFFFYIRTHHHHIGTICSCPTFRAYCAPNPFRVCAEFCKLLGLDKTAYFSNCTNAIRVNLWKFGKPSRKTEKNPKKDKGNPTITTATAAALAIITAAAILDYSCVFSIVVARYNNIECDIDLFSRSIQPSSNALGKNVTLFTTLSTKLRLTFVKFILGKFNTHIVPCIYLSIYLSNLLVYLCYNVWNGIAWCCNYNIWYIITETLPSVASLILNDALQI